MDLIGITEVAAAPGATWRPGDAWLGGGTWLFSRAQPGIDRLLDLLPFGWPRHEQDDEGITISATCTIGQLMELPAVGRWSALSLVRACGDAFSGSFKIRNVATVGGNLALALPTSPMMSLFSALDGRCTLETATGSRTVPVMRFATGNGTNVLRPGELIRSVHVPARVLGDRVAFRRVSLTPHGPSAAVVVGRGAPDGCHVTVTAATPCPRRLTFATIPSAAEAIARLDRGARSFVGDVNGSAAWRRHVARLLVAEVVEELAA